MCVLSATRLLQLPKLKTTIFLTWAKVYLIQRTGPDFFLVDDLFEVIHFKKIINKKKFSKIPPLLENGVSVANFQMKANIFNDHFVEQCSLINNDCALPNFVSGCNSSLSDIEITREKFFSVTKVATA